MTLPFQPRTPASFNPLSRLKSHCDIVAWINFVKQWTCGWTVLNRGFAPTIILAAVWGTTSHCNCGIVTIYTDHFTIPAASMKIEPRMQNQELIPEPIMTNDDCRWFQQHQSQHQWTMNGTLRNQPHRSASVSVSTNKNPALPPSSRLIRKVIVKANCLKRHHWQDSFNAMWSVYQVSTKHPASRNIHIASNNISVTGISRIPKYPHRIQKYPCFQNI